MALLVPNLPIREGLDIIDGVGGHVLPVSILANRHATKAEVNMERQLLLGIVV